MIHLCDCHSRPAFNVHLVGHEYYGNCVMTGKEVLCYQEEMTKPVGLEKLKEKKNEN